MSQGPLCVCVYVCVGGTSVLSSLSSLTFRLLCAVSMLHNGEGLQMSSKEHKGETTIKMCAYACAVLMHCCHYHRRIYVVMCSHVGVKTNVSLLFLYSAAWVGVAHTCTRKYLCTCMPAR